MAAGPPGSLVSVAEVGTDGVAGVSVVSFVVASAEPDVTGALAAGGAAPGTSSGTGAARRGVVVGTSGACAGPLPLNSAPRLRRLASVPDSNSLIAKSGLKAWRTMRGVM